MDTDDTKKVKLLLHSEDGSIPLLTPHLLEKYFPASSPWIQDHLVIGMAVKDTCISPVFIQRKETENDHVDSNEENSNGNDSVHSNNAKKRRKKRKMVEGATTSTFGDEDPSNKRQCVGADRDKNGEGRKEQVKSTANSSDDHINKNNGSNNIMKPNGYSFSQQIHDILPGYHSITVPTFDLVDDVTDFAKNKTRKNNGKQTKKNTTDSNSSKKSNCLLPVTLPSIPTTNKHVTLCTPHGMQKLDVDSYIQIAMNSHSKSVVGLYDQAHTNDKKKRKINCMARTKVWMEQLVKKNTSTCGHDGGIDRDTKVTEIRNIWSPFICNVTAGEDHGEGNDHHVAVGKDGPSERRGSTNFLVPFDEKIHSALFYQENIIGIAMVGLHHVQPRSRRINLLQRCSEYIKQSKASSLDIAVLVTKKLRQILDLAKFGVSIFGCDLPSRWARSGKALALRIKRNKEDGGRGTEEMDLVLDENGCIDLSCDKYCSDNRPLLVGCQCPSCKNDTYSRAYVHHLIKANELLGDILLFGHNLYQMLLLCKEFSTARTNGTIDSYCEFIENQLS